MPSIDVESDRGGRDEENPAGLTGDDKFAVFELLSRMYELLDAGDADGIASLYVADGRLWHQEAERDQTVEEIQDFVREAVATGREGNAFHMTGNPRILATEDGHAILRARSMKYGVSGSSTELLGPANLTMTARREEGRWKIARLEVRY